MFESYLSCRPFAVADVQTGEEVADDWGGSQTRRSHYGSVWTTETQVNVGDCSWYSSQSAMRLGAQSAFISGGGIQESAVFFFISPFKSTVASFHAAAREGISRSHPKSIDTEFNFDLLGFVDDPNNSHYIKSIEYFSKDGEFVKCLNITPRARDRLDYLSAIQISMGEICARVNQRLEMELDALNLAPERLAPNIVELFSVIRPYAKLTK